MNNDNIPILESLNLLLYDVQYFWAVEAACNEDYATAGSVINELIDKYGDRPTLLHLHAKIHAQQGNLKQAEFLWQKCIKTDADNRNYIAALAKLHKLQRSKVNRKTYYLKLLGRGLLFIVLIVFGIKLAIRYDKTSATLGVLKTQQGEVDASKNRNTDTQGENNVPDNNNVLFEISDALRLNENVFVCNQSSIMTIHFHDALFFKADQFRFSQKNVVSMLAKKLAPYSDKITVSVLGCTDDISLTDTTVFHSNNELSIARASRVYNTFYTDSRFLIKNLKIGCATENDLPYPNNNDENRKRNRTVIIKIKQLK